MPVPVPPVPTAHSGLHKCTKSGDSTSPQPSVFHLLRRTLPSSPTGPPPAFGSREQWINSLPSWRRSKTRYVWGNDTPSLIHTRQGFSEGLAGAVDAPAIKGAHVQTCIPPLNSSGGLEMASRDHLFLPCPNGSEHVQDALSSELVAPPELVGVDVSGVRAWSHAPNLYLDEDGGLSAPILEDDSPDMMNGDVSSSPIEPVTPFGDYVDRVVGASDPIILHDPLVPSGSKELQISVSVNYDSQSCQFYPHSQVEVKDESVVTVTESHATGNLFHKQLVDLVSDWMVSYVWKVCTNMLVLPHTISPYMLPNAPQLRRPVPSYLTPRVHSLLMSTLLQPSAMFLALWYVARLPVYFGAPALGLERVKERRFRAELLNDTRDFVDGESLEGVAAFRLIVLGCMLANKWLDDHTFSNKTWHTISNVPMQLLNKLEYLALDILSHDLSISPSAWSIWLSHLLSYNHSLSTTTYPQPIARPASNPNGLIRKTIQEIMEAPLGCSKDEPVFLGVDQRLKEKLGLLAVSHEQESFDIDLDEDGPLREEYLPRRRVMYGGFSSDHSELRNDTHSEVTLHRPPMTSSQCNVNLPPPAKWSPAGDEPICRPGDRPTVYLPVQPSVTSHYAPTVYHPWPTAGLTYAPFRSHLESDHAGNTLPIPQYSYWAPISCSSMVQHTRPVCTPEYYARPFHVRGYSLGFDYRCGDIQLFVDGTVCHPQSTASWTPLHQYGYVASRQSLVPHHPPLDYRSTWVQA